MFNFQTLLIGKSFAGNSENFKVFWTAFPTYKSSGDDSSPVNSMVCLYIPEI